MSELSDQQKKILSQNGENRLQHLVQQVVEQQEIWILTDEHGCVMLNTEDEDCIPVWPEQAFAQAWATQEWAHCTAEAISFKKWLSHWTPGLIEDELGIVVFPDDNQEGLILFPDELESMLQKKLNKSAR